MTREEFRLALHRGLGRAVLYARSHDVSEFHDVILDACVHCYAVDPTCEGTRADFMLDVIATLPNRQTYCDAVLRELPSDIDTFDSRQRFRFAYCLADAGDEHARAAMYEAYKPGPSYGESIGINFVHLAGIDGLLFAADRLGTLIIQAPGTADLGWLISVANNELGEEVVADALRTAGRTNPRIEAYRLALNTPSRRTMSEDAFLDLSYAEMSLQMKAHWVWLREWGHCARDEDFLQAANALLASNDPDEQTLLLSVFSSARFPLAISNLFKLIDNPHGRVVRKAIQALGRFEDPTVRRLAFRLIETRSHLRDWAIALLGENFQPGDHSLALRWYRAETDPQVLHGMEVDLLKLWEQHPDTETEVDMWRTQYEHTYCSFNREMILRRLLERNAITEAMREECRWDANSDIREIFNIQAGPLIP